MKPGRNEPCHCGSGRKYKHCCTGKDEIAERDEIERATRRAGYVVTPGASAFTDAIDRVRRYNPNQVRRSR